MFEISTQHDTVLIVSLCCDTTCGARSQSRWCIVISRCAPCDTATRHCSDRFTLLRHSSTELCPLRHCDTATLRVGPFAYTLSRWYTQGGITVTPTRRSIACSMYVKFMCVYWMEWMGATSECLVVRRRQSRSAQSRSQHNQCRARQRAVLRCG